MVIVIADFNVALPIFLKRKKGMKKAPVTLKVHVLLSIVLLEVYCNQQDVLI